ncbi:MAG TPA: VanW family protein [Pseudobacteroides sp.]|uniref:VanW family protein n=1 Tax=Pseudobacteroides sp. TaxID=1968840 RepID=UPI002F93F654
MKTYMDFSSKRYLSVVYILLSIMIMTSCSSRGSLKTPGNQAQQSPPVKVIEFPTIERTVKNNVYLNNENVGSLKESELISKIMNYAATVDTKAADATLDSSTWQINRGKVGKKVNVDKTIEALFNAQEGDKIDLVVDEIMPLVTSQNLMKNIVTIGSYTTSILDKDASRVNNIKLASRKINGFKLSPGEEFSFNTIVGRRTEEKGYEDATIIVRRQGVPKKGIGVGGGICQVSSTLFNAAEACNLNIIERHKHSKTVGYVPKGKDATVNYGSYDFRFSNSRSYPIMVRTYLSSETLTVKIIENRNS